ncbi:hypothetical protein SAMN05216551_10414 [Chitinasiproducens palmae]|uniref:Uncharacterized protein n=1 Tax=Chitinasiproducens palmae TaxID=1770053 RepID=A0A1H2PMR8_9BURK|nr:hypothetical protein SAMN05216551_10414 [Chitinasiproducens palmae]
MKEIRNFPAVDVARRGTLGVRTRTFYKPTHRPLMATIVIGRFVVLCRPIAATPYTLYSVLFEGAVVRQQMSMPCIADCEAGLRHRAPSTAVAAGALKRTPSTQSRALRVKVPA